MERRGPFAALILAAALGACTPVGPRDGGGPAGDVEVATELDIPTLKPREGELATVIFRIRNATRNYLVLRDLTYLADPDLKESASAAASWQFGMTGKITFAPDANEWSYDRTDKTRQTAALFNSGLIAPTETVTVRTRIRLLSMPKNFQLLYFELPFDKVRSDVYFEARQNREIRYRALIGEELRTRLTPDPRTELSSHRTVLYPFAERVEPTAKIKSLRVDAELHPRSFSLLEAVRRSGGAPAEQYTCCSSLDAWILKRGAAFSMVTPAGTTALPLLRQMDRTFYFIDSMGVGKIEVELQNDGIASIFQLEKKYPIVVNKTPRETRYFLFLTATDLVRFFGDARTAKLAIDVEMTADGGGRLRVVGTGADR